MMSAGENRLHIRELRNGHMVSEDGEVTVVDVFYNENLSEAIINGDTVDEEILLCVHWEGNEFYVSTVSLLPDGEQYDSLFTETLIQQRSNIEKFVADLYESCGLMLARVTVRPLGFEFFHVVKDSFSREGKKLLRQFREFYRRSRQSVPNLKLQVQRRSSSFQSCKYVTHYNFEDEKTSGDGVGIDKSATEIEKSNELRFSAIEKEMAGQSKLMESNFSILKHQNETLRNILSSIMDVLKENRKHKEKEQDLSIDARQVGSQDGSVSSKQEDARGPNEGVHDASVPTEKEQTKEGLQDQSHHRTEIVQQRNPLPPLRLRKDFSFPKYIPSATVEDYRKAHRDAGITKDDIDTNEDQNIGDILSATLARERERLSKALVNKVKIGATKCGRESIINMLTIESLRSTSSENAGLWFGIDEALQSERGTTDKTAVDTVICIHTSEGMSESEFKGVRDFVLSLLGGLEDIAAKHKYRENVGLVASGGKTPVVRHLSKDYGGIREDLNKINPTSPSPLAKALIFSMACLTGGGLCTYGNLRIPPRLIMMTDGVSSEEMSNSQKKNRLFATVRAMGGDHIRSTITDPIIWIPIGNANKDLLRQLAEVSNGLYQEEKDIESLCNYQKIKRVSANVLAYMTALGVDPDDPSFAAAFEACGQDLKPEEKYTVANFVAHKLCKVHRELGEMDNFNNIILHDGLPPLGTRVVRGPDWSFGDQDSGFPGTVVNHGQNGDTVWVLWDSNMCGRYGYSSNTGYDLLVCDRPKKINPQNPMEIGVQVERGPDWNYGNEDGGPNCRGVVIRRRGDMFKIRWDNGRMHDYRFRAEAYEIWVKSTDD